MTPWLDDPASFYTSGPPANHGLGRPTSITDQENEPMDTFTGSCEGSNSSTEVSSTRCVNLTTKISYYSQIHRHTDTHTHTRTHTHTHTDIHTERQTGRERDRQTILGSTNLMAVLYLLGTNKRVI